MYIMLLFCQKLYNIPGASASRCATLTIQHLGAVMLLVFAINHKILCKISL